MSQIPESLTGGWKEVPLCIQLAKSGNQGGIVDIARMLRWMNDAMIYIVRKCIAVVYSSVQCIDCCSKHLPACSRLADWWSEHEWVRWWDPPDIRWVPAASIDS